MGAVREVDYCPRKLQYILPLDRKARGKAVKEEKESCALDFKAVRIKKALTIVLVTRLMRLTLFRTAAMMQLGFEIIPATFNLFEACANNVVVNGGCFAQEIFSGH